MKPGKTKADLLRVMVKQKACRLAFDAVYEHPSDSAEEIGISSPRPENLEWLLFRKLTTESSILLRKRLNGAGYRGCWCHLCMGPHYLCMGPRAAARAILDDCWRAWCRS